MKAAFLDWDSLNGNELDASHLEQLPVEWQYYARISPQELEELIKDIEVIVSNKVVLDAGLISRAQRLKLICVAATGTNNIDLESAADKSIPVCNVRGYATESVIQHVFMLILNLSRRFLSYQQALQEGQWQRSEHFCFFSHPIESLTGKILGIIGYGELGQAVANMAKQFGMKVLIARSLRDHSQTTSEPGRVELEEIFTQSDVVSLHCPLTERTRNLVTRNEFALMKSSAFLINTARGGIVNEDHLLGAIRDKQIAGAATDVLTQEPPVNGHPLLDAKLPNLIVTPHIAWGTKQARQKLLEGIAENIQAWLQGQVRNQVN
ncbi:MAG: NAD(P)-dependent oxidoreductase [Thioalkalispiraceae bacterium]|jgi:glycerate dehydrogenase